jgi:hypothetical protein
MNKECYLPDLYCCRGMITLKRLEVAGLVLVITGDAASQDEGPTAADC